jgi:hypothetical protein
MAGRWDLLELELSICSEVDFLVLKISKLNGHKEAIFALSPLDFWE